jgi:hypothetical protein
VKYLESIYGELPSLYSDEFGYVLNYSTHCFECGGEFERECKSIRRHRQRRLWYDKTPQFGITRVYLIKAQRGGDTEETSFVWVKVGVSSCAFTRISQFAREGWEYEVISEVVCPSRAEAYRVEGILQVRAAARERQDAQHGRNEWDWDDLPSWDGHTEWYHLSRREAALFRLFDYSKMQDEMETKYPESLYYPSSMQVACQFLKLIKDKRDYEAVTETGVTTGAAGRAGLLLAQRKRRL